MAYKKNYKKQSAKETMSEARVKQLIKEAKPKKAPRGRSAYNYARAGGKIGKMIGHAGGRVLDRWLGSGDYEIRENTLIKPSSVPVMHSADSSIRITHKEFISDITATAAFSNQSYSINPGLSSTFPYLSGIAQNFESYRLHGMVFTFKSTSADSLNSTNTALGSMMLATDYNVLDSAFTTKAGFLATTFSNSGKPAQDIIHPVECSNHLSSGPEQRYIRYAAPADNSDLRLYDWGNFQIGSIGQQATSVVGELWVSYDIELINPQLVVPRGLNIVNNVSYIDASTISNTVVFGTGGTILSNTQKLTLVNNTMTLPAGSTGNYLLTVAWFGSAGATATMGAPTYNNAQALNIFVQGTSPSWLVPSSTQLILEHAFSVVDPQKESSVTLNSVTLPLSVTACDVVLVKINGNL